MEIKNRNIGIGNTIKTDIHITREPFEINKDWFIELNNFNSSKEFNSKFDSVLYEEQGLGEEITDSLFVTKKISIFSNEVRILHDWLVQFREEYLNLKDVCKSENISINKDSLENIQLEYLANRLNYFHDCIDEIQTSIQSGVISSLDEIPILDNERLEVPSHYGQDQRKEKYFADKKPSDRMASEYVFRRVTEIINQIPIVNRLTQGLKEKVILVTGNAGMGKSNLSAFLSNKISEEGGASILLRAKSFSGESTELESLILKKLQVPDNYTLKEVLDKINGYGLENNIRIAIIIDGLNETTYTNQGFSPIWRLHLNDLIDNVISYSNIYFIATLRTSYKNRIWPSDIIPYNSHELTGFSNENLKSVVKKYFDLYKITFQNITSSDIFYFRTPLLLDLYCKMLNPRRQSQVEPLLGLTGFKQVFKNYINNLTEEVRLELDLPTTGLVHEGISKCSDALLSNLEAQIEIIDYYRLMGDGDVRNINNTIGNKILEGFLIYIQDSINLKDVVVHTQQEVGGYLLSNQLLLQYKNIQGIVNSDFFQTHLIGKEENLHQLKDDILKFLIVESEERKELITQYSNAKAINDIIWQKLQREPISDNNMELRDSLLPKSPSVEELYNIINNSRYNFVEPESAINIDFIKKLIFNLESFDLDRSWTKYIYNSFDIFIVAIDDFRVNSLALDVIEELHESNKLNLELAIWLLESTIKNVRDKATHILLEYGTIHPHYIFNKLLDFSTSKRLYIYERLAGICYGVCLRRQNDKRFINGVLKSIIPLIYKLQFSKTPKAPSFHYIVIDSFKHMVDIALFKGVFKLDKGEIERLNKYQFTPRQAFTEISEADINKVRKIVSDWHDNSIDPLRGDFVTYTIPRIIKNDYTNKHITDHVIATAYIYKRLLENGYIPRERFVPEDAEEQKFYFGENDRYIEGKVDRLGKKYSWNALFEYAGFLLNKGELDVWYGGDDAVSSHYTRLSDVELEVSYPAKTPSISKTPLVSIDLLEERGKNKSWTQKEFFDVLNIIKRKQIDNQEYTLLRGDISQKFDESYDVRSFLIIESFFVKKEGLTKQLNRIDEKLFSWDDDFHASGGNLSKTYFGELYWADSIPNLIFTSESIPTGKFADRDVRLLIHDVLGNSEFKDKKPGDIVKRRVPIKISINVSPTMMEYLWETDSNIYPGLSEFIPSPNIGKQRGFKSDPKNLRILDTKGEYVFIKEQYKPTEQISQELYYLRTDELSKYLDENDLFLLYQIKQHSYDRTSEDKPADFRGLKFSL
ncbi:hypothetical protein [uncultured Sunxiuqinia sp.]|uniref:hypothetical protein n=1 Tax=uncultured Sunxiuqinia sp. TaxID=1573825 RepID=UPI002AA6805B|nr:hypothetical protein [uncultured Sunxiuqinia sp.]